MTYFIDACVENYLLRKAARLETQAPVGRLPLISYASVIKGGSKPGFGVITRQTNDPVRGFEAASSYFLP